MLPVKPMAWAKVTRWVEPGGEEKSLGVQNHMSLGRNRLLDTVKWQTRDARAYVHEVFGPVGINLLEAQHSVVALQAVMFTDELELRSARGDWIMLTAARLAELRERIDDPAVRFMPTFYIGIADQVIRVYLRWNDIYVESDIGTRSLVTKTFSPKYKGPSRVVHRSPGHLTIDIPGPPLRSVPRG